MASHEFQIKLRRVPSDPPTFPAELTLTECMWCYRWWVREPPKERHIPRPTPGCPHCRIEELESEVAESW